MPQALSPLLAAGDLVENAEIERRLAEWSELAAGAYSKHTEAALRADTEIFAAWCMRHQRRALPASPETVAAFLREIAFEIQESGRGRGRPRAMSTIERYAASIAKLHQAAKVENPVGSDVVKLALRSLRQAKGTRRGQAKPLNWTDIEAILAVCEEEAPLPGMAGLAARRDAALVSVAYDTGCRRSELVRMDAQHLREGNEGAGTVLVPRTKGDTYGHVRYLAPDTYERLARWMHVAGIVRGPLFRAIDRWGHIAETAIDSSTAYRILRRRCLAVGIAITGEHGSIGGHSARVGACQDAIASGAADLPGVMQAYGWKSPTQPARYAEHLLARRGASAKLAELQGRAAPADGIVPGGEPPAATRVKEPDEPFEFEPGDYRDDVPAFLRRKR